CVTAVINRMRPIAMTTFAAILALLPLALGFGQGAAMLKPLAIAIISGLVFQLPLVLIVFPCLLALVRRDPKRKRKRDAQDHQPSAHTGSALAFRHNARNEAKGSK